MASSNLPVPSSQRSPARPAPAGPTAAGGVAAGGVSIDPVRIARTYWPIVLAAFIVSCVLGVGLYILLGKYAPKFTSTTIYLVTSRPNADVTGDNQNKDEMEKYMGTQVAVMTSDFILRSAIDTNEVRNNTEWIAEFRDPTGGIDVQEALKALRKMVSATADTDTTLIRFRVTASNPSDAAVLGQAIQTRYARDNRETNVGELSSRLQDVTARLTDTQAALQSVEETISARTRAENIDALNAAQSAAATEIRQIQPELVTIRSSLSDARETLEQRERVLGGQGVAFDPENTPVGFVYPEAVRAAAEQTPIVNQLDIQISQIEARKQSLSNQYGEGSRIIERVNNELRSLKDQRSSEIQSAMANRFAAELESLRNAIPRLERTDRELTEDLEDAKRRQNELAITLQGIENLRLQQTRFAETIDRLDGDRTNLQLMIARAQRVRVLQAASTPDSRSFPQAIPVVGATVVVLTGLVAALIFLKELREQRVRTPQDIAAIPRTRVVGVLPEASMDPSRPKRIQRASLESPDGAIAESVRQLRATIVQRMDERGHKSVLIGSGLPGSGATTIAANLAISLASTDRRVLIIDANLRRPAVHTAFDLDEGPGLADVLRGQATLESAVTHNVQGVEGLSVLPAGSDRKQAYERFLSEMMERVLQEARDTYDVVIIDVAPGVVSSDMMALGAYVDCSVLVVKAYEEKRGLVARLRNQLAVTGSEFLGVVVNAVKPAAGGYMKRNFEQTLHYQQQPKRVMNTASPEPKASKKKTKKLRGGSPSETTGAGADTKDDA